MKILAILAVSPWQRARGLQCEALYSVGVAQVWDQKLLYCLNDAADLKPVAQCYQGGSILEGNQDLQE